MELPLLCRLVPIPSKGPWGCEMGPGDRGSGLSAHLPQPLIWLPGRCKTGMVIFGEAGWGFFKKKKTQNLKHKMYLSARKINIFAESSWPSCQL